MKAEIDRLVVCGVIEESDSTWASPLVPITKPDGSISLCVDYRKVNSLTVKSPYYMSTLDEILARMGNRVVLSKLDLTKGFHQV